MLSGRFEGGYKEHTLRAVGKLVKELDEKRQYLAELRAHADAVDAQLERVVAGMAAKCDGGYEPVADLKALEMLGQRYGI